MKHDFDHSISPGTHLLDTKETSNTVSFQKETDSIMLYSFFPPRHSVFRRLQQRKELILILVLISFLFILYVRPSPSSEGEFKSSLAYYIPHQRTFIKYNKDSLEYKLAVICDRDQRSKNIEKNQWESLLKKGTLKRNKKSGNYTVTWESEITLSSKINEGGRGMELSELVFFDDHLLAADDRTGIVYWIDIDKAIPLFILMDGNGRTTKGFKIEWMTVKDGLLYIGSMGKEWTSPEGVTISTNPQWIKTIDSLGKISHIDWREEYQRLRSFTGTEDPGYLLHEAVAWNPVVRRWFFFPRRKSTERYDEVKDEERGSNIVLSVDEHFHDLRMFTLGPLNPIRGFSSITFLPGREFEMVALKTEEFRGNVATYMTVFDVEKELVLMEEELISNEKFEGVEIF